MAFDLDTPTIDDATTDRGSEPAVGEPSTPPRAGRSPSARSIVGWAIVGALVAATVGFVIAVIAGEGDGADRPAPGPVTVEDVSGSDRHLENLADELEERGTRVPTTTPNATPDSGGDGEPEATATPDSTTANGSDRHLENMADELAERER